MRGRAWRHAGRAAAVFYSVYFARFSLTPVGAAPKCVHSTHNRSSAMARDFTTDVLICGAGAAGLTLAIDLARQGVRFRLIDKLSGPFAGSRGKGVQPRTQEVFEDLGIIDRIAAAGSAYPPQREYRADGGYHDIQNVA